MVRRLIFRTAFWLVFVALMLFASAGTIDWPGAWAFIAENGVLGLASGLALARSDPELLRERMAPPIQSAQKPWDKLLLMLLMLAWLAQYVVAGLDHRFQWSVVPVWLQVAGALAIALALYVFHAVMRANTFAAPVVKIQAERKHHVVSTGPYALVRHPMYAGAILLVVGTAFLLGSWLALLWSLTIVAVLAVRATLEERTLVNELEGYSGYASRVRYRLVPGVW